MIDELTHEERWVWIGLLLLAGDNVVPGEIGISNRVGYTDEQLCEILDVPCGVFSAAKLKMIKPVVGQKEPKIHVSEANVISICKWGRYQSEYRRQSRYRKGYSQKLLTKVTTESDQEKGEGRREKGEGRKRREIREKKDPPLPIDASAGKAPRVGFGEDGSLRPEREKVEPPTSPQEKGSDQTAQASIAEIRGLSTEGETDEV
jgi:hypothetical protein